MSSTTRARAHVLVLPYPAQGHVIALMQLSQELVKHGIKVTFVNTDFNHKQIMKANLTAAKDEQVWNNNDNGIEMVSIPDGLEDGESRSQLGKLTESLIKVMPKKLEMLIQEINNKSSESDNNNNKISCVVADGNMGMALEVAEKMGIQRVAFWPFPACLFVLACNVEKLLDCGIIDSDGTPAKDHIIQLSPEMPAMRTKEFPWILLAGDDLHAQKILFNHMRKNNKAMEAADWVICHSAHELEPLAFDNSAPKFIPIGPFVGNLAVGSFWTEDSDCLNWLDQQPNESVIYVAFGSFSVFDQTQLQELALGLELSNVSFLWAIRPDIINNGENHVFLKAFQDRLLMSSHGKLVGWAPQQKVLSHPSIACFLSHCGWNSTIEGVTSGVPFVCWPYFADHFVIESYICDIWKVGLRLDQNQNGGIVGRGEIRDRVKQVLNDKGFKSRALELKEKVLNSLKQGGCSSKNMNNFIDWIKSSIN